MTSSATSRHVGASGRRLTPPRFEDLNLPLTFESLTPLPCFPSASVIEETEDGNDYLDVLTEVTDTDEAFAEQWEAVATEQSTTPLLKRIDSFDGVAREADKSTSIANIRTMSTTITLKPIGEDEQLACASFCGAPEYVELLFDAETPHASDEDLALRSRSLTHTSLLAIKGDAATEECWQLEHDPVLRYATTCSFLPGRDSLHNITTCSLAIEYDRDIDDLYRATACFLGDCHDGECTCLDDRRSTYCVPGENFVLTDKNDDFRLSFSHPTAKDIFELMDELVDVDMFDTKDGFDNGRLLYSPTLDDVSNACGSDNVSETSETNDKPGLSPPRYSEIAYVDADTHKCIAYTALNQLLSMQEDQPLPVAHRDIPDDDDYGSAELKEHNYLNLKDQAREAPLPLRDDPCPSRFWSDFTSGFAQPPALPQPNLGSQSALVPAPKPLSTVDEEQLSWPSPSSSGDSIDFADHQGFMKSLEGRQQGFLADEDEDEGTYVEHGLGSPVMPSSSPHFTCEEMFTDAVWDSAPDLTLAQPNCELYAAATPTSRMPQAPPLETFEIEVHDRLTFIFSCMNDGRYDELPALCNDLHWTLCVLAHDSPAMVVLDSLGAAVEILAERIIASTPAS
ncbi:hypothetical protein J4E91_002487 [Alternaria rosae]|nr:hypothetical protein J4E91_002487 [Alternaria rosae]